MSDCATEFSEEELAYYEKTMADEDLSRAKRAAKQAAEKAEAAAENYERACRRWESLAAAKQPAGKMPQGIRPGAAVGAHEFDSCFDKLLGLVCREIEVDDWAPGWCGVFRESDGTPMASNGRGYKKISERAFELAEILSLFCGAQRAAGIVVTAESGDALQSLQRLNNAMSEWNMARMPF